MGPNPPPHTYPGVGGNVSGFLVTHSITTYCGTFEETQTVIPACSLNCDCPADYIISSASLSNLANILPSNPSAPVNLYIAEELVVNTPAPNATYSYTFPPGSTICLAENAKITINNGSGLKFDGSTVKGCDKLWEAIHVESGGKLEITNSSTIQDGLFAVQLEAGSKFLARNSTFNKNFISVNIMPVGNPVATLIGNTFDGTGNLLPTNYMPPAGSAFPVPGLKPWAGIYSLHEIHLNISKSNTFKNLSNGIISDGQGSLIVTRSSFDNILENPEYNFSGFGIHASPPLRGSRLVVTGFGSDPLNDPPSFKNCSVGVHGENITMSIQDNIMLGMQKIGVEGHLLGKHTFGVRSNFIESETTGISLIEAPLSSVVVRDNVLNISTDGTGIRMENVNDVYSSPLLKGIRNNIIKMKGGTQNGGILIQNSAGLLVKRNDIDLSLSDNKLFGIRVDGSFNNAFSCNTVTGNGTDNNQSKGFMITSSLHNFYTCNTNSANYIGVQFNNICNGTEFRGNQFLQNGIGLQYSNMGMTQTGPQNWRGNTWDDSPLGIEFQNIGINDEQESQFKIQEPFSPSSYLWPRNGSEPIYSDWFVFDFPSNNSLIFECPTDLYTCDVDNNFTDPGPCEKNEFLMNVAKGLTDTSFRGGIKWMAERYLFQRLHGDCTNAAATNSDFSTFYSENLHSTVGKFHAVAKERAALFELDSSKQQLFQDYSLQLDTVMDSVRLVDDSLADATDHQIPALLAQKEAYLQNLETSANALHDVAAAVFNQQVVLAGQLKSGNDTIAVNEVFEENEKTVNHIYLSSLAVGISDFSRAQVAQLQTIAEQCPLSGGEAVYMARAMLDIGHPQAYDDHTICTDLRERAGGGQGLVKEDMDCLLVYPNPATNEINLVFAPVNAPATLLLADVFGHQFIRVKLAEGTANYKIQTDNMNSGLYFIRLHFENKRMLSKTVMVSK